MKPAPALIVLATLLGLPGCARPDRAAHAVNERPLALLSEAEFDEFAGRVAESLAAAISTRQPLDGEAPEGAAEAWPAVIRGPIAMHNGALAARDLDALADALAAGLNDRTGGLAVFRGPSAGGATLIAEVLAAPAEAGAHLLTLVVRDANGAAEYVRESIRVEPQPVLAAAGRTTESPQRPDAKRRSTDAPPERQSERAPKRDSASAAPRPTAPTPEKPAARRRKLNIDADPRGLLERVREQAEFYRERTAGRRGAEVLFLDDSAWKRHRLVEQRTQRTDTGRLRVELDFRARQRRGDASLRVIFIDEAGRQIEVTPVLPYRFLADYTTTVAITSASRSAAGYLCLLDD